MGRYLNIAIFISYIAKCDNFDFCFDVIVWLGN